MELKSTVSGGLKVCVQCMCAMCIILWSSITYLDTQCDSKRAVGALVDLLFQQRVDVVIGPPCSQGKHYIQARVVNTIVYIQGGTVRLFFFNVLY